MTSWATSCCCGARTCFWATPGCPGTRTATRGCSSAKQFSLSMLVAIEDSPPDNCTVFVPGSHRLTVPEKEDRYGVSVTHQAGGNVRYAGDIPAEIREPQPLEAGEMSSFTRGCCSLPSGFVDGRSRRQPSA